MRMSMKKAVSLNMVKNENGLGMQVEHRLGRLGSWLFAAFACTQRHTTSRDMLKKNRLKFLSAFAFLPLTLTTLQ